MTMRWYEGMFMFDSALVSREQPESEAFLKGLFEKHAGKIHSFEKFDDRKLAYEIGRVRRGTYYLVTFQMNPAGLSGLKRDCNLSEKVLRHMIVQEDNILALVEQRKTLRKKREEEALVAAAEGIPRRRR